MGKELQVLNQENRIAVWGERISACRNSELSVAQWCKVNGICVQTYYRWQRKLFVMAQAQQESRFAEITPNHSAGTVAVTIRIAGAEMDIYSGIRYNKLRKLPKG